MSLSKLASIIDPVVFALAARADGVTCREAYAVVKKVAPWMVTNDVATRLSRLAMSHRLARRFVKVRPSRADRFRHFLTETQADTCLDVVSSRSQCTLAQAPPGVTNGPGVYRLNDLQGRCSIDQATGCWNWGLCCSRLKGAQTPVTYLPPNVAAQIGCRCGTITAAKAAWLLSGRPLPKGHLVWRTCLNELCIAPSHLLAGTRKQQGAWLSASGHNKGNPLRRLACVRNGAKIVTPIETVRLAEEMFARGDMQRDVRLALGLAQATAKNIRLGNHRHSSGRVQLLRGASVFALGAQT